MFFVEDMQARSVNLYCVRAFVRSPRGTAALSEEEQCSFTTLSRTIGALPWALVSWRRPSTENPYQSSFRSWVTSVQDYNRYVGFVEYFMETKALSSPVLQCMRNERN